nr:hypothetical protein [Tanacetum cinerariifolium]
NLNGYNAVQNVRNQVAQNPRVQNNEIRIRLGMVILWQFMLRKMQLGIMKIS